MSTNPQLNLTSYTISSLLGLAVGQLTNGEAIAAPFLK